MPRLYLPALYFGTFASMHSPPSSLPLSPHTQSQTLSPETDWSHCARIMADAMLSSANFRLAAMDLARRLSSLQHYVTAASELIARCEQLQQRDISRHSRKIVALIEISRHTLVRFGLRLYCFAACPPAMAAHKASFFDMLQLLKNVKPLMDLSDHELRGRIDRLLLPLSSNLRIATAEDTAAPQQASASPLLVSPSQSPSFMSAAACTASTQSASHSRSSADDTRGKMLPPDVLMSRSHKRRAERARLSDPAAVAYMAKARQANRQAPRLVGASDAAAEKQEDAPAPVSSRQTRRRFGIFCTQKPCHRRMAAVMR